MGVADRQTAATWKGSSALGGLSNCSKPSQVVQRRRLSIAQPFPAFSRVLRRRRRRRRGLMGFISLISFGVFPRASRSTPTVTLIQWRRAISTTKFNFATTTTTTTTVCGRSVPRFREDTPPCRFAPCRLDVDTPLSSIITLIPQSPLPSRRHSWLPSFLTLPWLPYTSFHPPPFSSFFLFPCPHLPFLSRHSYICL